jgi:hypothetical protein
MKRHFVRSLTARLGLAVAVALITAAGAARAGNLYVATNATDTYNGSEWTKAYTNLQDALNVATNGDTIHVAGQTFPLATQLVWTTSGVTLRGGYKADPLDVPGTNNPALWPTVLAIPSSVTNRVLLIQGVTNAILENVALTGGKIYPGAGALVTNSVNVIFSGCVISNNAFTMNSYNVPSYGAGLSAFGTGTVVTLTNCLIRGNTAKNNGTSGSSYARGGGVWSEGILTICDSRIIDNTAQCGTAANGLGGGVHFNGTNLILRNVLLANNASSGYGRGVYVGKGTCRLANCTLADHRGEALYGVGGTVTVSDSIFHGTWSDTHIGGNATVSYSLVGRSGYSGDHNIGGDPLFQYGYYLATNSPCVDMGSNTSANAGLAAYTTRTDGMGDTGAVDQGWHYSAGFNLVYADLYVAPAPTGNDGNSGTNAAQALATVTKALSLARDGSRIHVAAGAYTNGTESFPLAVREKIGVELLGTNSAQTIINAKGSGTRVVDLSLAHRTLLKDITLTGGTNYPAAGLNISGSQDVLLSGCVVSSNTFILNAYSVPSYGAGLYAVDNSSVTLSNCLVKGNTARNNGGSGASYANGGGIWSNGKLTVRESVVADNVAYCGTAANGRGAGLYFDAAGTNLVLVNVVLANNNGTGGGDGVYLNAGLCVLSNVTVAGNAGEGLSRATTNCTVTVRNSILWGNGVDSTGGVTIAWSCYSNSTDHVNGGNNMNVNPLFVDATFYHLQSRQGHYTNGYFSGGGWGVSAVSSPCIDAGDGSAYSREPEPNGGQINLGAYGNTAVASKTFVVAGTLILIR